MCWLNERPMHIDDLADRVSFLPPELLNMLAHMRAYALVRTSSEGSRSRPSCDGSQRVLHIRAVELGPAKPAEVS